MEMTAWKWLQGVAAAWKWLQGVAAAWKWLQGWTTECERYHFTFGAVSVTSGAVGKAHMHISKIGLAHN